MKILCFEINYIGFTNKLNRRKIKKIIISEWLNTNNKIKAIKKHRELTGSGLKEAKEYCDDLQMKNKKINKLMESIYRGE